MSRPLSELYEKTDDLMRKYRNSTDAIMQHFYLSEVQELAKEFVLINCRRFINEHNVRYLDEKELYEEVGLGTAFLEAVTRWDENSGVYFLTYYQMQQYGAYCNVLARSKALKRVQLKKQMSLDSALADDEGKTFMSSLKSEYVQPDAALEQSEDELMALLEAFCKTDKYGDLILRETMARKAKNVFTAEVLGVEKAGARERQIAERTRRRFKNFCENKGFDVIRYRESC